MHFKARKKLGDIKEIKTETLQILKQCQQA